MADDVKKRAADDNSALEFISETENRMPHDLKVERAVLSAMLREPRPCVDIVIEHLGTDSQVFYSPVHRVIFENLMKLHKEAAAQIDLVLLMNILSKEDKLESIGGELFLAELYGEVPTTVNLESWCKLTHSYYILRQMIGVCSVSLQKCYNKKIPVNMLVDEIENDIYKIRNSENKSNIVEIKDGISKEFETLLAIYNKQIDAGISTGYTAIDELTGGLKKGEMFVLAARPSIGKTAIALNIIRNMALDVNKPRKVAFFSLEMTAEQIIRRLLCSEAKISETTFWNHTFDMDNLTKLTKSIEIYRKSKIFIDPTGGLTIAELRAKARRLKMLEGIDVIVIDYLQLMTGEHTAENNRQQEVAGISSGIKQLAKDLNVPVLVLAQLNREVDKTSGASTRPKLSHLRESGAIEQDADIVSFLHRDRDQAKDLAEHQSVEAFFIVEKNRNGKTGTVPLNFFPAITRFEVASKYKDEDGPK